MILDIPNIAVLGQSAARPLKAGRAPFAMAEDLPCVIYAIETNNQPRFGCN
jgi:hypothetical protein